MEVSLGMYTGIIAVGHPNSSTSPISPFLERLLPCVAHAQKAIRSCFD